MIVRDQIARATLFNLPIGPATRPKTPVALSVLAFVSVHRSVKSRWLAL